MKKKTGKNTASKPAAKKLARKKARKRSRTRKAPTITVGTLTIPKKSAAKAVLESYAQAIGLQYPAAIHKRELWELISKSRTALTKITPEPTNLEKQEAYETFEVLDDTQMADAMTNRLSGDLISAYAYEFPTRGGVVTGLSKEGIYQACLVSAHKGWSFRQMGPPIIKEDPEPDGFVRVVVEVGRYQLKMNKKTGEVIGDHLIDTMIGAKRQWKKQRTKRGGIIDDPFAFEKAMAKANRNARRDLLPYPFKVAIIEQFRQIGRVSRVSRKTTIGDRERKKINAVAAGKGMDHTALLKWLGSKYGVTSTNQLTPDLFREALRDMEAIKALPEMPESIREGIEIVGMNKADAAGTWARAVEKYGDKAEEKMGAYLQKLADEGGAK